MTMFSGIVESKGVVGSCADTDCGKRLSISVDNFDDVKVGDSVLVNGVCLTVCAPYSGVLEFDVMNESLDRSNLGSLTTGDTANLERSLALGDRIHGHLLYGHVDTTASFDRSEDCRFFFNYDGSYGGHLPVKGTVAVNGVSLTITHSEPGTFAVDLIPTTLEETNLSELIAGGMVNIEIDMLARYVESLIKKS